jgi:hypothetical protein
VLEERLYVVTPPKDVAMVFENSVSFFWNAYMDRLLDASGLSKSAREISRRKPAFTDLDDARMKVLNPQYFWYISSKIYTRCPILGLGELPC